jgi:hypothetical protein
MTFTASEPCGRHEKLLAAVRNWSASAHEIAKGLGEATEQFRPIAKGLAIKPQ